jgi:hypothetical protein
MAQTISATDTELQKPVNVVFQQTFLRRAQQNCPYFMGTMPGQINKQQGTSTIKWRRIEQETPSTTALTELTTTASSFMQGRDADTPTFTDVTATVAKYGQFYIVNEEVDLYNPNGTTDELVEVLGESAGRSLNQLQRDIAEDNSTQRYAANVASTGAVHAIATTGDLNRVINELTQRGAHVLAAGNGSTEHRHRADPAELLGDLPSGRGPRHRGPHRVPVGREVRRADRHRCRRVRLLRRAGRGVRFIMSEDASVDAEPARLSGADLRTRCSPGRTTTPPVVSTARMRSARSGLGKKHTDGTYRPATTRAVRNDLPPARFGRHLRSVQRESARWLGRRSSPARC